MRGVGVSAARLRAMPRSASLTADRLPICKHFFPCNEGAGNVLTCAKTGLKFDESPSGSALQWGIVANAVRSTSLGSDPPINFINSNALQSFDASKNILFVAAGRVVGDVGVRVALGDNNEKIYTPGYGFGLADAVVSLGNTFHCALTGPAQYPLFDKRDVNMSAVIRNVAGVASNQISFSAAHNFTANEPIVYSDLGSPNTISGLTVGSVYFPTIINSTTITVAATLGGPTINVALTGGTIGIQFGPVRSLMYLGSYNGNKDIMLFAQHTPATGLTVYRAMDLDTGADIVATDEDVGSAVTTGTVTFNPCMRFSGLYLYGFALHQVASLPAVFNVNAFLQAQGQMWRAGDKSLYPGLLGLAA